MTTGMLLHPCGSRSKAIQNKLISMTINNHRGTSGKDSGVLISEKRQQFSLMDLRALEKIFIVDTHVGASFAGLGADGRVLID
jgi:20S proteasome alpha/beta subunit